MNDRTDTTTHTPLPWMARRHGELWCVTDATDTLPHAALDTTKENAEYIVRACNAYPELVDLLDEFASVFSRNPIQQPYETARLTGAVENSLIDEVRAALAKAHGSDANSWKR